VTGRAFRGGPNELSRLTAHEYAREMIRRAILRGDFTGGERLVQTDIAAQLKISTTPVREAMRDLATQGLITHDAHRGGVVREQDWTEMQHILAIRRGLDPVAVQLAMSRVGDAQLLQAEDIADLLEHESDLGNWVELNERFHFIFHEATGSWRLTSILQTLEEAAGIYVAQAQRLHPEVRRQANQEHRQLIAAYQKHDQQAAIDILNHHVALPVESTVEDREAELI